MEVKQDETADQLLARSWRYSKQAARKLDVRDHVFKVVGRREFLVGNARVVDFEYIQRSGIAPSSLRSLHLLDLMSLLVALNQPIILTWVTRKLVEVPRTNVPYIFQKEEVLFTNQLPDIPHSLIFQEFLSTDPVIKYDHAKLTRVGQTKPNTGLPLVSCTCFSSFTQTQVSRSSLATHATVWDLQLQDFKVKIIGCTGIPPNSIRSKNSSVFLKCAAHTCFLGDPSNLSR